MKTSFIIALAMILPASSIASTVFTLSKTYRAKNVLHYEAVVKNCKFVAPYVTAQWRMGEEKGQIEGLTATEKKHLQPKVTYSKENDIDFKFDALKEIKVAGNSFKDVNVRLVNCKPIAFTNYNGSEIELQNINLKITLMNVAGATITGKKSDGSRFILNLKR